MFTLIRRAWNYLVAWLGAGLESVADPRIQVEQAIEEAKRQHQLLTRQAAAVLGNQRELEIRLSRSREEAAGLHGSARRSLQLASSARAEGDEKRAASLEQSARLFAGRLAVVESSLKSLEELYQRAELASAAARRSVEQNALALQRGLTERTRLLTELEAARMQERMAAAIGSVGELAPASGVPTLARVRERIDSRFALAAGTVDLASSSTELASLEVERSAMDEEASRRLALIQSEIDESEAESGRN